MKQQPQGWALVRIPKRLFDAADPTRQSDFKGYAEILSGIVADGKVFPKDPDRDVQTDWQLGIGNDWWFGLRGGLEDSGYPVLRCRYGSPRIARLLKAALEVFFLRLSFEPEGTDE